MKDRLSLHHRVPESHWWLKTPFNMLELKERTHRAFHMVMDNRTPVWQYRHLLHRINWMAHSKEFYQEMEALLDKYSWEKEIKAYAPWVLKEKKFLESLNKFPSCI